ncbi:DNA polymerase III subunit beta [Floccifex sp.]|uniref:DNA polymerase III subunit beta n=1 Tax=Floccifex sp. TaxID=2815810 RepID=UPI003EFF92A9
MKFSVLKKDLLKAATQCSKAIDKIPNLPMYSMILVEVDDSKLTLTGSNGVMTIRSNVDIENFKCITSGSICVESKHLCGFVSKMNDGWIMCEYADSQFVISTDYGKFHVACAQKEEYPNIDFEIADNELGIDFDEFCDSVSSTIMCTYENQQRPVLGGINISSDSGKVTVCASDSRRVHLYEFYSNGMENMNITLPKRTCNEVINLFDQKGKIYFNSKKIQFVNENLYLSSGLLTGSYPNVGKLVPKNTNDIAMMNSSDVIGAVERSRSILNEDKIQIVKIDFGEDVRFSSVQVGVASTDEVLKNSEKISENYFSININAKHLKDAVNALNCEQFILEKKEGLNPMVIRSKGNTKLICILTPIRVWG